MRKSDKRIFFIDRIKKNKCQEKVLGYKLIVFLYGDTFLSKCFGSLLLHAIVKRPFFAYLFGLLQSLPSSRKKIAPFIKNFDVDASEFADEAASFSSFNSFFIRRLKSSCRPIASGERRAVIPADGRYLFYPKIDEADGFVVKGKKFCLQRFLQNERLAHHYSGGSMVMARLCPSDYHRFHFPVDGIPQPSHLIKGRLFSVNPLAVRQRWNLFTENRRVLTAIDSLVFGRILYVEVGATCVGRIHQTFVPHTYYPKGAEKGYFSFGGSSIVLLFEKGAIVFDSDLCLLSKNHTEVRCLLGQSMGVSPS